MERLTGRQVTWYNGGMGAEIKFGEKIYSRGEVARATGLSVSHVSRIFGGKRTPSLGVAKRLAICLQVSVDTLLELLPKQTAK